MATGSPASFLQHRMEEKGPGVSQQADQRVLKPGMTDRSPDDDLIGDGVWVDRQHLGRSLHRLGALPSGLLAVGCPHLQGLLRKRVCQLGGDLQAVLKLGANPLPARQRRLGLGQLLKLQCREGEGGIRLRPRALQLACRPNEGKRPPHLLDRVPHGTDGDSDGAQEARGVKDLHHQLLVALMRPNVQPPAAAHIAADPGRHRIAVRPGPGPHDDVELGIGLLATPAQPLEGLSDPAARELALELDQLDAQHPTAKVRHSLMRRVEVGIRRASGGGRQGLQSGAVLHPLDSGRGILLGPRGGSRRQMLRRRQWAAAPASTRLVRPGQALPLQCERGQLECGPERGTVILQEDLWLGVVLNGGGQADLKGSGGSEAALGRLGEEQKRCGPGSRPRRRASGPRHHIAAAAAGWAWGCCRRPEGSGAGPGVGAGAAAGC